MFRTKTGRHGICTQEMLAQVGSRSGRAVEAGEEGLLDANGQVSKRVPLREVRPAASGRCDGDCSSGNGNGSSSSEGRRSQWQADRQAGKQTSNEENKRQTGKTHVLLQETGPRFGERLVGLGGASKRRADDEEGATGRYCKVLGRRSKTGETGETVGRGCVGAVGESQKDRRSFFGGA